MIYFIQQGEDGPVKIGYATVIEKRFRALQSASPYPLKVIGSMQGSVIDEKRMHLQFSKHRLQGEWFEPDLEIIKYASECDNNKLFQDSIMLPINDLDLLLLKIEVKTILSSLNESESIHSAAINLNISYRSMRHRMSKYGIKLIDKEWSSEFI